MPWEFEDFKYPSNMAPPLQASLASKEGVQRAALEQLLIGFWMVWAM